MLGQGPIGLPNLAAIAGSSGLSISPSLFGSQTAFFLHTVVNLSNTEIDPFLFSDPDTFFVPAITKQNQIIPETVINVNTFPQAKVAHVLLPGLFVDSDGFFVPTVGLQSPQNIIGGLFVDTDLFFAPLVNLSLKLVSPGLFVDPDTFFEHRIIQSVPQYQYTYPIGRELGSDYGIRASMSQKERPVLGHRYGRRR